jgi:hypothetical protein
MAHEAGAQRGRRRGSSRASSTPGAPATQRETKLRQKRANAVAAECGDAVEINPRERYVKRQCAAERHESDAFPPWDLYAALHPVAAEAAAALSTLRPTPPKINNFVATAQCMNCVPDMQRLAWFLAGLRSHGDFAHPVTASLHCVGSTFAMQPLTGIMNVMGNRSPSAAAISCWQYIELVARHLRVPLALSELDIYNMQATWNIGGSIDMHALHRAIPNSVYNPDLISHMSVIIKEPRVTALVYPSGAVVVNGCRARDDHMRVFRDFGLFLSRFVRAGHPRAGVSRGMRLQSNGLMALRPTLWNTSNGDDSDADNDDDEDNGVARACEGPVQ